ncbi:aspartate aminotransferase family protein [Clostridia bacterium]|nr:aspartate aminotransferase family protein [Clostridia bacterium]
MTQGNHIALEGAAQRRREERRVTEEELLARIDAAPYGEKSKALARKAVRYESLGGASWGLFPVAPIIERGEGSLLYDADGTEYIDMLSGFSVSNLGNCFPAVTEAIRAQAGKLTHFFDLDHPERIRLAERLSKLSGISGKTKVLFGTTGSDAVESAVRAARYYTGRPYILVANGDYHGVTAGTIGLTTRATIRAGYLDGNQSGSVGFFGFPHEYRAGLAENCGFGMEALDALDRSLGGNFTPYGGAGNVNVAAILVEPFQSSNGYYIPPRAYLKELRRICDTYGVLLILDEVQTGLGRTGKLWAYQHSDIEPDIITSSKTLGGGLPLSAVIAKAEILSAWGPTAHINTQAANAISCAASHAVLDAITAPDFLPEVNKRGDYFAAGLAKLAETHPSIGYIDHQGLYIGLEFVLDRERKTPAPNLLQDIRISALRKGLILDSAGHYDNRLPLIPALNIPYEIIDRTLAIFDEVLSEAEQKAG